MSQDTQVIISERQDCAYAYVSLQSQYTHRHVQTYSHTLIMAFPPSLHSFSSFFIFLFPLFPLLSFNFFPTLFPTLLFPLICSSPFLSPHFLSPTFCNLLFLLSPVLLQVHYFSLNDNNARGYVRQYALSYISSSSRFTYKLVLRFPLFNGVCVYLFGWGGGGAGFPPVGGGRNLIIKTKLFDFSGIYFYS